MTEKTPNRPDRQQPESTATIPRRYALLALLTVNLLTGCAALTNPTLNGIPVRRLPTEILTAPRREACQSIPLALLQQNPPEEHVLGPGDVLGVYIPGVLPPTAEDQPFPPPPVNYTTRIDAAGVGLPPSVGYPVEIRRDGSIMMPLIAPIQVQGMTLPEAHDAIGQAYLDAKILPAERASVLVTLMQARTARVLVFREEVGGFQSGGVGDNTASNVKQGTGHTVELRVGYQNDVLHALSQTGGLPGLDAYDSIFIFRGGISNAELMARVQKETPDDLAPTSWSDLNVEIVHIPTRLPTWEPMPFQPEDILLFDGDVVMIESRSRDFFYTGGLLPRGEFQLPRDYDLDVVEAVAQVRGTLLNGAFGGNNLNGLLIQPGIGNPNPSALTVVRRTPNGGQISISVDLNRALRDPRERIIVQASDVLILQETVGEATSRYISEVFNFNLISNIIQRGATSGTAALNVP